MAVANPSTSAIAVNVDLYGLDGTPSGLPTATINIPPGGQIAKFINELFPGMPASFQGIANLTTASAVTAVALRGNYNERGDFLMTTTPPLNGATTSSGTLVFPQVVTGQGFSTQIVLFGNNAGSGKLYLLSSNGVLQPIPSLP
jgi:hypothetical protein